MLLHGCTAIPGQCLTIWRTITKSLSLQAIKRCCHKKQQNFKNEAESYHFIIPQHIRRKKLKTKCHFDWNSLRETICMVLSKWHLDSYFTFQSVSKITAKYLFARSELPLFMQCQESWHHSCAMTCAEVIQLAQAQHEKMTQQEGNTKLPVKFELSWPADSSVLISTNLSGQLLFKHMQEQGRTGVSIIIFFLQKSIFLSE